MSPKLNPFKSAEGRTSPVPQPPPSYSAVGPSQNTVQASPVPQPPPSYSAVGPSQNTVQASPTPHGAPPPAYTDTPKNTQDPYTFLKIFDTAFLIDDSSSMGWPSGIPNSTTSRWHEVSNVLRQITPFCTKHDGDGIDVYFINYKSPDGKKEEGWAEGGYHNVCEERVVERIFDTIRPFGLTPTGERLKQILGGYVDRLERAVRAGQVIKPLNLIVITDGEPSDKKPENQVRKVLIDIGKRLTEIDAPMSQLGVQFFQVGREPAAKDALQDLDDGLATESGRDIVDTMTWDAIEGDGILTSEGILKTVLGGVNRRLDETPQDRRP